MICSATSGNGARIGTRSNYKGAAIPRGFTCDGPDLSPPLAWEGAPTGTRSFALMLKDPDAPGGTFSHWVAYNIPGSAGGLPEGAGEPRVR